MNKFRKLKYKGQNAAEKFQTTDIKKKKKEVKAVESGGKDTGTDVQRQIYSNTEAAGDR